MRLSLVEIVLFLAAAAVVATAVPRCSGGGARGRVVRASWTLTPGVLNPAVTQATIASTICRHGWTRTIRPPVSYTNGLKAKGLRQYRLRGPPSAFQDDHLISLELGCSGGHPEEPSVAMPRDAWVGRRSERRGVLPPDPRPQTSRTLECVERLFRPCPVRHLSRCYGWAAERRTDASGSRR